MMNIRLFSVLSVLLVLLLCACSSPSPQTPEERLRHTLEQIETGVEARSMQAVMDRVDADYIDHRGQSKPDIARILQLQYIKNQSINLLTAIQSLEIEDNLASVEIIVAMAGRGGGETAGLGDKLGNRLSDELSRLNADSISFSAVFTDRDDNWLLTSLSWQ